MNAKKPRYDSWLPVAKTLPTKLATVADDLANLPREEAKDYSSALPLDAEAGKMHKLVGDKAPLEDKTYMFPESYNALRRELVDNWPALFKTVGYAMAFDAISFIEMMDSALDTKTTFDSAKVAAISNKYLNLLRAKRGVSAIH